MRGAVATLALMTLSGCMGSFGWGTPQARPVSAVQQQEQALIACHSASGTAAPLLVQTVSAPGQPDRVVAVAAGRVPQSAADRLNQCAAARLAGAGSTAYPSAENARARALEDLNRRPEPQLSPGCASDTSVLRGGVAYCPKGTF